MKQQVKQLVQVYQQVRMECPQKLHKDLKTLLTMKIVIRVVKIKDIQEHYKFLKFTHF